MRKFALIAWESIARWWVQDTISLGRWGHSANWERVVDMASLDHKILYSRNVTGKNEK